jgi:hypothetical protein
LHERRIDYFIWVCASSYTELTQRTADIKQAIGSAVNPITSGVGITLYDFATPSGSFYATAGTMDVEIGQSQFFNAADQSEEGNRKYRSVTPIMLSAFKDITASLLENKGRINLTDS